MQVATESLKRAMIFAKKPKKGIIRVSRRRSKSVRMWYEADGKGGNNIEIPKRRREAPWHSSPIVMKTLLDPLLVEA